jgi:hypothetical protein
VEKNGNSEQFKWSITTYLYDIKKQKLDDILEGFLIACVDFIQKSNDNEYAESYIKELIEFYYHLIFEDNEKTDLKNRIISLFYKVKEFGQKKMVYDDFRQD